MACREIRNKDNEITEVKAQNLERSKLYDDILDKVESLSSQEFEKYQKKYKSYEKDNHIQGSTPKEISLAMYKHLTSPRFIKEFGDYLHDPSNEKLKGKLDYNNEPRFSEVEDFLFGNKKDILKTNEPKVSKTSGVIEDIKLPKEINPNRTAEFQKKIQKYNDEHNTNYKIKWKPLRPNVYGWDITGGGALFSQEDKEKTIGNITYSENNYKPEDGIEITKIQDIYNNEKKIGFQKVFYKDGQFEIKKRNDLEDNKYSNLSNDEHIKEVLENNNLNFSQEESKGTQTNNEQKVKMYSPEEKEVKSSKVLKDLANTDTYLGNISTKMLEVFHNDADMKFLPPEELIQYMKENNIDSNIEAEKTIGGLWHPFKNTILVSTKSKNINSTIIHEGMHSLVYDFLKSNHPIAKSFNDLYEYTKSIATPEELKHYGLKNVQEFFSEGWVKPSFQRFLAGKKSTSKWYTNLWQEWKTKILDLIQNHLGLDLKERTLLHDFIDLGSNVLHQANEESKENEVLMSMETNYTLASLDDEDKDKIRGILDVTTAEANEVVDRSPILKLLENNSKSIYKEVKVLEKSDIISNIEKEQIKSLFKTLSNAKDNENIYIQSKAIASTMVKGDYLLGLLHSTAKDLALDTDKAKENITKLHEVIKHVAYWEDFYKESRKVFNNPTITRLIDSAEGKVKAIDNYILQNDKTGLVQTLRPYLLAAGQKYADSMNQGLKEYEKLLAKSSNPKDKAYYTKMINDLKQSIEKHNFLSDELIMDYLKGKVGDSGFYSFMLESYRDNPDPIISSFTLWLKHNLDDVVHVMQPVDRRHEKELAPYIKQIGGRFNPAELGRDITFKNEVMDSEGNISEQATLLNEWDNNWQKHYQELKNNESKFEKDNSPEYFDAKKARQDFEESYMNRPYKDAYYEATKKLESTLAGQEYKKQADKLWAEVNEYDNFVKAHGLKLGSEELAEKDTKLRELESLASYVDLEGNNKEGFALEMAKSAREYKLASSKLHNYTPDQELFDSEQTDYSNYLISKGVTKDSEDYQDQMNEWHDENTRIVIKPEYWKDKVKDQNIVTFFESKTLRGQHKTENLGKLFKERSDLVYGYRDEDGQLVGTEMTAEKAEKIKDLDEKIEKAREDNKKVSNLNDEEQTELDILLDRSPKKRTKDDKLRIKELIHKSSNMGLSDDDKEKYSEALGRLMNMNNVKPTDAYVESFNNLSQKYGITINDSGIVEDTLDSVLEDFYIETLLNESDFKEWFNKNHIQVDRFNFEKGETAKTWVRTHQWNKTIPRDDKYISIEPTKKYSTREVKPELVNPQKQWETVDNRGNYLPKKVEDGAKDDRYYNKKYYALKNAPKGSVEETKYKYLEIQKKYHLEAQDYISDPYKRLGMRLPAHKKENVERNMDIFTRPRTALPQLYERLKTWWKTSEDYTHDTGNYKTPENEEISRLKSFRAGTDLYDSPLKGLGKIDYEGQSLDTSKLIMQHYYSAVLHSKLNEISPTANAMNRILNDPENSPLMEKKQGLVDKIKSGKLFRKDGENNRGKAIKYLTDREFKGRYKAYELGETGDRMVQTLKYLGSWSYLKLNIPGAISNTVYGITQNYIYAGQGYINKKDLAYGTGEYTTRFFTAWQKDYWENEPGKYSLEGQMADKWEFIDHANLEHTIGTRVNQSKLRDFAGFRWILNARNWSEYLLQSRLWLAFLHATKVEDGKGNLLSLDKAYELDKDGIIKLKEGIDKKWDFNGESYKDLKGKIQQAIRRTRGSYAKYDQSALDQYTAWSFATFLKKYFVAGVVYRYGADNVNFSLKGGITSTPRFNIETGTQWGYYMQSLNAVSKMWSGKTLDWGLLTNEEKGGLFQTMQEVGVVIASTLILKNLFNYNEDDKNKTKKLKNLNPLELQALYQILRLQKESQTYVSPNQYGDFISNQMALQAALKYIKVVDDIVHNETYTKNTKSGGVKHKKGEHKAIPDLKNAIGINSLTLGYEDPTELITRFESLKKR